MLSVAEALNLVLENAHAKLPAEIALSEAIGLVLAEDVTSDIDSPPHDKSIVDGYAVRAADLVDGRAKLEVLEEITAGVMPSHKVSPGACSRIMTGAPVPEGADAVVMIERTQFYPSSQNDRKGQPLGAVKIHDERFRAGQNIMRCGKSLLAGETILHSGAELGPAEIGLLAEVGRTKVQTIGPVALSIISTGNELVAAGEKPGAGQIRNSNSPLLAAAAKRAGAVPNDLGIVRDKPQDVRRAISEGLKSDLLVISGGVSAGVLDLVPAVLAELGVRQVFHKINLKPGKPLWFGVYEKTANRCLVFGLPGNPVSSLVSFEIFVKPAIGRIAGRHREPPHARETAKLTVEFTHRGDRPTYWPAMLITSPDGLLVEPRAWQGSADLRGFSGANALIAFASGDRRYQPGDVVEVRRL